MGIDHDPQAFLTWVHDQYGVDVCDACRVVMNTHPEESFVAYRVLSMALDHINASEMHGSAVLDNVPFNSE